MAMTRGLRSLIGVWTVSFLVFLYVPIVTIFLVALSNATYFSFPVKNWSTRWFQAMRDTYEIWDLHYTSFTVAAFVTVFATILGLLSALAFARYDWRGRKTYQKVILLPVFFPQAVLGLAQLLWISYLGLVPTWKMTVFAHLVWIVPVVTLVIAIQVYGFDGSQEEAARDLGASRVQIFKDITLPGLSGGIISGALFAFLLSWSNFPLTNFTSGADSTVPEWLYTTMSNAYTPVVAATGALSILGAAALFSVSSTLLLWRMRSRSAVDKSSVTVP